MHLRARQCVGDQQGDKPTLPSPTDPLPSVTQSTRRETQQLLCAPRPDTNSSEARFFCASGRNLRSKQRAHTRPPCLLANLALSRPTLASTLGQTHTRHASLRNAGKAPGLRIAESSARLAGLRDPRATRRAYISEVFSMSYQQHQGAPDGNRRQQQPPFPLQGINGATTARAPAAGVYAMQYGQQQVRKIFGFVEVCGRGERAVCVCVCPPRLLLVRACP